MIKYLSDKLLNNIINKLLKLFNLDFKSYNLFKFIYFFKLRISYMEKEMATHSSVLAWRIPGTGEPGGLPSMGLHRVGHD